MLIWRWTTGKRVLIYSCFYTCYMLHQESVCLINKRHLQFNFLSKVVKASLWSRIVWKPIVQPMTKSSQLICGLNHIQHQNLKKKKKNFWATVEGGKISHFLSLRIKYYLVSMTIKWRKRRIQYLRKWNWIYIYW